MLVKVWGQTDVGLKRGINQDSILVDKALSLFIVADGMGGHKGGEVASALAVQTIREVIDFRMNSVEEKIEPRELIAEAFRDASARIHRKSTVENPQLMGMGTTVVAAFCHGQKVYVGNVGDSRAYLFVGNNLWQLTEDHSLINEQVRAGVIKEEDIEYMSGRNVITRSVGFEREVLVDVLERDARAGEAFLLCSDGLSGLVSNREIAEIVKKNADEKIASECVKKAKEAGGDDNISVIFFKIFDK